MKEFAVGFQEPVHSIAYASDSLQTCVMQSHPELAFRCFMPGISCAFQHLVREFDFEMFDAAQCLMPFNCVKAKYVSTERPAVHAVWNVIVTSNSLMTET